MERPFTSEQETKRVSFLLWLGVLLFPYIFAWAILSGSYSKFARTVSLGWLLAVLTFYAAALIQASNMPASKEVPVPTVQASEKPAPPTPPSETPSAARLSASPTWEYSRATDQMRDAAADVATLTSRNKLDLGFPYGAAPATLRFVHIVENLPGGQVSVDRVQVRVNGQFDLSSCDPPCGCTIQIKFDDGPIEFFQFCEADGHPPGVLESSDPRLAGQVRTASKMWIDAIYFQVGHLELEFDVKGLKL